MRILSFDVGIKNLALCDLTCDAAKFTVNEWSVKTCLLDDINVNITPINDIAPLFYKYVKDHATAWLFVDGQRNEVEHVFIEAQPMGGRGAARNLKTKVLSHILQCVVSDLRPDVRIDFIHPGLKLKDMPKGTEKSTYRENKAYAVTKCLELISSEQCENTPFCQEALGTKGKRDDLADAFLQGLIASRMHLSGAVLEKPKETKPKVKSEKGAKKAKSEPEAKLKSEPKAKGKSDAKSKKKTSELKPEPMAETMAEPMAEPMLAPMAALATKKSKGKSENKPDAVSVKAKKRKISEIVADEVIQVV